VSELVSIKYCESLLEYNPGIKCNVRSQQHLYSTATRGGNAPPPDGRDWLNTQPRVCGRKALIGGRQLPFNGGGAPFGWGRGSLVGCLVELTQKKG